MHYPQMENVKCTFSGGGGDDDDVAFYILLNRITRTNAMPIIICVFHATLNT